MASDEGQRYLGRDSLFLLADMRVEGISGEHRVRVRNLSAGGLMAEGIVVQRGRVVEINLRNIGWVEGTVAWVQENRCGVAFASEIDPLAARAPVVAGEGSPRFTRVPVPKTTTGTLRKV